MAVLKMANFQICSKTNQGAIPDVSRPPYLLFSESIHALAGTARVLMYNSTVYVAGSADGGRL